MDEIRCEYIAPITTCIRLRIDSEGKVDCDEHNRQSMHRRLPKGDVNESCLIRLTFTCDLLCCLQTTSTPKHALRDVLTSFSSSASWYMIIATALDDTTAKSMDETMARPYMLNDFVVDTQRLSACLPPDNWDPESPRPMLSRQPSGVFVLVWLYAPEYLECARLTIDVSKPPITPADNAKDATDTTKSDHESRPGWLKRMIHFLCRYFRWNRIER